MDITTKQNILAVVSVLTLMATEVSPLQCYQCFVDQSDQNSSETKRLCTQFDHSQKFIVDCPFSTMCMKQHFQLEIQNGVKFVGVKRGCASQKHDYLAYNSSNRVWVPKVEILEPYTEGCIDMDNKGERIANYRYCYCHGNLCNNSPNTSHEGYTDIMGVIVVFNLMKYINSLR